MKFRDYVTEGLGKRPKKGDMYKDIRGDVFKIATVSGGTAYIDVPGTTRRDVIFVKHLVPDETGKYWVEN